MGRTTKVLLIMFYFIAVTLLLTDYAPDPAYADNDDLRQAGDVLQIALPLTALGATFWYDDPEGRAQFGKSFLTSWTIVYGIKTVGNKVRPGDIDPDEEGNLSYPSGHTMSAFSGASFLSRRYGYLWGIPAYALAALVGYSRVDAQAHYLDDVIVGGSIAMLSNWYYTTPYAKKIGFTPILGDDKYGLALHVPMESTPKAKQEKAGHPNWRFTLNMGPVWPTTAKAASPSDTGTEIDLTEFDDKAIPNGSISIEYLFKKRHDISFKMMPVEFRQNGSFNTPVSFAGQTFPADTPTRTRYRLYEYSLRYRYELLPNDPWSLKVGLGLGYFDAKVGLTNATQEAQAEEWSLLPLAHLYIGYNLSDEWRLSAATDFFYSSDHWHDNFKALVHYKINPNWEVAGGYKFWAGKIDESDLRYQYTYQGPLFSVSYSFY